MAKWINSGKLTRTTGQLLATPRSANNADNQVLALESGPFQGGAQDYAGDRKRQRGFIEVTQSLLLTTLAVVATAMPFAASDLAQQFEKKQRAQDFIGGRVIQVDDSRTVARTPLHAPQTRRTSRQPELETNRLPLSAVTAAPFVPIDLAGQPGRRTQVQYFTDGRVIVEIVLRAEHLSWSEQKRRQQQVDQSQNALPLTASAAPFIPSDLGQHERRSQQHVEQQPNQLAFFGVLEAPFAIEELSQPVPDRLDHQDFIGLSLDLTATPFGSSDFGPPVERKVYQQVELETSEFPLAGILAVPFIPVEFPQPDRARWDRETQPFIGGSLDLTATPFAASYFGEWERRLYQQIEQQPNQLAFFDVLEAPFRPDVLSQPVERNLYQQVELETSEFPLGVIGAPFVPVEFPQPDRARWDRETQGFLGFSLNLTATPFTSSDLAQQERKQSAQDFVSGAIIEANDSVTVLRAPLHLPQEKRPLAQPEQETNLLLLLTTEATPFATIDTAQQVEVRVEVQDFVGFSLNLTATPFLVSDLGQSERKLYQQVDQPPAALLIQWPFASSDLGQLERKLYQQVEPETSEFPLAGILAVPFVQSELPQPDRTRWDREAQDFVAINLYPLYEILAVPFVPVEFPQPDRARWDLEAQDLISFSLDLMAMPFASADLSVPEPRRSQQQVEQAQNVLSLTAVAPFVTVDLGPQQQKRDHQGFVSGSVIQVAVDPVVVVRASLHLPQEKRPLAQSEQETNLLLLLTTEVAPFATVETAQPVDGRADAQDFLGFSLDLTAMPFPASDFPLVGRASRAPDAVEVNLHPLHDAAAVAPFVPSDQAWYEAWAPQQQVEQVGTDLPLLAATHFFGKVFLVPAQERVYIVERVERLYIVDEAERLYIVETTERLYLVTPNYRIYVNPED